LSSRDCLTDQVGAEDLSVLDERLRLLSCLWTEVLDQVSQRRVQIEKRLERWSDFDEECRQLMEAIAQCESAVEGVSDVPIEDLLVALQTVSWFCVVSAKMKSTINFDNIPQ